MRSFSEPDMLVRAAIVGVLVLSAFGSLVWWRLHTQDREARRAAMPGCVARLGSEGACEARFDQHHRQCFTHTNKPAGKYSPRQFDAAGYLECVLAGSEEWARARRDAKDAQQKRDRAEGIPER